MTDFDGTTERRSWLDRGAGTRELLWGGMAQGASSATNLGLSLLAARALGPEGLGVAFVGFSLYLALVGFQRALLSDPLVALTTSVDAEMRRAAQQSALTVSVVMSAAVATVVAGAGLLVPEPIGPGLITFAPWILAALLQDFWRVVLFQQKKGRAGALNDLMWVVVMAALFFPALRIGSLWAVVGCWGLGAVAGGSLGFLQTRLRPGGGAVSFRWWRETAWPMGRWLGLESLTHAVFTRGLVFALAFMLGAASLGGLRAVQSVYAPLSLIGAALALPALPEVTRRLQISKSAARQYVVRLGGLAALLTVGYIGLALLGGSGLLSTIFGRGFVGFEKLVLPVGTTQLVGAAFIGFPLLLKGLQESRALFAATLVGSVVALVAAILFAASEGVLGAAWGIALGAGVKSVLTAYLGLRGSTAD